MVGTASPSLLRASRSGFLLVILTSLMLGFFSPDKYYELGTHETAIDILQSSISGFLFNEVSQRSLGLHSMKS